MEERSTTTSLNSNGILFLYSHRLLLLKQHEGSTWPTHPFRRPSKVHCKICQGKYTPTEQRYDTSAVWKYLENRAEKGFFLGRSTRSDKMFKWYKIALVRIEYSWRNLKGPIKKELIKYHDTSGYATFTSAQ